MAVAYPVKFHLASVSNRGYLASPWFCHLPPIIQFSFPHLAKFCLAIGSSQLSLFINGNHSIQRGIPHYMLTEQRHTSYLERLAEKHTCMHRHSSVYHQKRTHWKGRVESVLINSAHLSRREISSCSSPSFNTLMLTLLVHGLAWTLWIPPRACLSMEGTTAVLTLAAILVSSHSRQSSSTEVTCVGQRLYFSSMFEEEFCQIKNRGWHSFPSILCQFTDFWLMVRTWQYSCWRPLPYDGSLLPYCVHDSLCCLLKVWL